MGAFGNASAKAKRQSWYAPPLVVQTAALIQQLWVNVARRHHGRRHHCFHVRRREIHRRLKLNAKPVRAKWCYGKVRPAMRAEHCSRHCRMTLRWDALRWNEKRGLLGLSAAAGLAAAAAIGRAPRSAVVASSAFAHKAMAAPAVAVAPSAPWAHAQEDAVVEVPRPVIAIGRAGIRRIAVVAVRTARLNADVNHKLRLSRWRQGQAGKQCCRTE